MSERDIVENLREEALVWEAFDNPTADRVRRLTTQARAEILRLRAADAARAAPDEEVANIIARAVAFEKWDEMPSEDELAEEVAMAGIPATRALRAAGFTVIRTEARDGAGAERGDGADAQSRNRAH